MLWYTHVFRVKSNRTKVQQDLPLPVAGFIAAANSNPLTVAKEGLPKKKSFTVRPNILTTYFPGQTIKNKPRSGWAPKPASWFQQKMRKLLPKLSCVQTHELFLKRKKKKNTHTNKSESMQCWLNGWICRRNVYFQSRAFRQHTVPKQFCFLHNIVIIFLL